MGFRLPHLETTGTRVSGTRAERHLGLAAAHWCVPERGPENPQFWQLRLRGKLQISWPGGQRGPQWWPHRPRGKRRKRRGKRSASSSLLSKKKTTKGWRMGGGGGLLAKGGKPTTSLAGDQCTYCKEKGLWKNQCPNQEKSRKPSGYVKEPCGKDLTG